MKEQVNLLLQEQNYKELKILLESIQSADIADIMHDAQDNHVVIIFRLLPKDEAAETFTYMESDLREKLIHNLNAEEIKDVMEEIYLDDAADIIEELPANVVERLLDATDDETRNRINELLNYPDDSAGSIMTVEYIHLSEYMTVGESIRKIRGTGMDKETVYTCYVTDKRVLQGIVLLKDMLESDDEVVVKELMCTNYISVHTDDDQEDVAKLARKYGLLAMPVLDSEERLVGIVTADDVIGVLQDETTEDINKMAAMLQTDETYFEMSIWQHAKSRIPWLLFLMLSSTMAGMILNHYAHLVATIPLLVSFVPMIMGTGGNCGSQSSSLIIRGLAVDEINFSDILKVIFKEARVALMVGAVLAMINILRIYLMYDMLGLGIILGITLMVTIFLAKVIGCTLPLFADKFGLDPAIMAAPLITTMVDSASIAVYFALVTVLIKYI